MGTPAAGACAATQATRIRPAAGAPDPAAGIFVAVVITPTMPLGRCPFITGRRESAPSGEGLAHV